MGDLNPTGTHCMTATAERLRAALDDPAALEALYRLDQRAFQDALEELAPTLPPSPAIQFWQARLQYRPPVRDGRARRLGQALGIGVALAALVRIPALWLNEEWYYPRLAPSLVILAVAAYFWFERKDRTTLAIGGVLAAVVALTALLLPATTTDGQVQFSDSVIMAILHLPVLCWTFLGFTFAGAAWRQAEPRVRFIRYNGELLILGTLVGLSGIVFSLITVALFSLVIEQPEEWYFRNIGIIGAVCVPLAATYLYDVVFNRRTGIASVLTRIFAPLFLVMTLIYLTVAILGGQNPFIDRDFLITVNGLLVLVLGMTGISIAERGEGSRAGWVDHVNLALLAVTLVMDLLALSAIVFRLASYGFTPNRVVVLGANLVVLVHLAIICRAQVGLARGSSGVSGIRQAVTGYLPVYAAWAAVVAFVLPFVFGFA